METIFSIAILENWAERKLSGCVKLKIIMNYEKNIKKSTGYSSHGLRAKTKAITFSSASTSASSPFR